MLDLAPKQTKEVEAASLQHRREGAAVQVPGHGGDPEARGAAGNHILIGLPSDSPAATWSAGRDVDDGVLRKCRVDTRTLRTAQEAYFARASRYAASTEELVSAGMLSEPSSLHRVEFYPSDSPSTTDRYGTTGPPHSCWT